MSSQTSWTWASPSVVPKNVWVTRSCGSRSISSSEIPPSMPDRRQQDLVGPAAGEDLGDVGDEQGQQVDRRDPGRRTAGTSPSTVAAERDAADDEGERDERRAGGARSSAVVDGSARGRRAAPGLGACAARLGRHPSRPLETHPDLADLQLVTEAHRRDAVDATAVDVRPVRAAEVLEIPAPTTVGQHRVIGRGERVVDHDRVVDVAPERR